MWQKRGKVAVISRLGILAMSLKILRAGFLFFFFALICISGDLLLVPVVLLGLNKFKFVQNLCRDLVRVSWGFFYKKLLKFVGIWTINLSLAS